MTGFVALPSNHRWTDTDVDWPERPAWQARAACRDLPTDLFFPGRGEDQEVAVQACRRCPVRAECLDFALEHGDAGVWGGTSSRERARIRSANRDRSRRRDPIVDERRRAAASMQATGMTVAEIAAALDTTRRTVHRYLEEAS